MVTKRRFAQNVAWRIFNLKPGIWVKYGRVSTKSLPCIHWKYLYLAVPVAALPAMVKGKPVGYDFSIQCMNAGSDEQAICGE
jgi:hypothetical protein